LDGEAGSIVAGDLAHALLEAPELANAPVVHDDVVAQKARPRATDHLAVGDEAAGDRTDAGDVEHLTNLDPAEDLLLQGRLEEAFERIADVVHRVVDDRVEADVDPFPLGERGGLGLPAPREAADHRVPNR